MHRPAYADGFEQKRYVVCVINLSSVHSKNSACAQRLLNSISHILSDACSELCQPNSLGIYHTGAADTEINHSAGSTSCWRKNYKHNKYMCVAGCALCEFCNILC
jgi:hypothetical protein